MDTREERISETIRRLARRLPRDSDGKFDYSDSPVALSVTVFIKYRGQILLLKRSDQVRTYQGKWCPVTGYLEDLKPIREKALEEVHEETGISSKSIVSIHIGKPYEFKDPKLGVTWIDHPVLLELKKKPDIELDWEHTEYRWIDPEELNNFDTVPGLHRTLEHALQ